MADPTLATQLGAAAVKSAPPVLVTLYAAVSKGLPLVISFLTLVYLAYQISHGLWTWRNEWLRKRDIDRQLSGPVAEYKPRIPK